MYIAGEIKKGSKDIIPPECLVKAYKEYKAKFPNLSERDLLEKSFNYFKNKNDFVEDLKPKYYCIKCGTHHFYDSDIGKEHMKEKPDHWFKERGIKRSGEIKQKNIINNKFKEALKSSIKPNGYIIISDIQKKMNMPHDSFEKLFWELEGKLFSIIEKKQGLPIHGEGLLSNPYMRLYKIKIFEKDFINNCDYLNEKGICINEGNDLYLKDCTYKNQDKCPTCDFNKDIIKKINSGFLTLEEYKELNKLIPETIDDPLKAFRFGVKSFELKKKLKIDLESPYIFYRIKDNEIPIFIRNEPLNISPNKLKLINIEPYHESGGLIYYYEYNGEKYIEKTIYNRNFGIWTTDGAKIYPYKTQNELKKRLKQYGLKRIVSPGKNYYIRDPFKLTYQEKREINKNKGKGWHGEPERHSKAKKTGHADFTQSQSLDFILLEIANDFEDECQWITKGGKHICLKKYKEINQKFKDWNHLEKTISNQEEGLIILNKDEGIPWFEKFKISVGDKQYIIQVEGWFDECMPMRNKGLTSCEKIKSNYKEFLPKETGLIPDKIGYIEYPENEDLAVFGITYIAQEIKGNDFLTNDYPVEGYPRTSKKGNSHFVKNHERGLNNLKPWEITEILRKQKLVKKKEKIKKEREKNEPFQQDLPGYNPSYQKIYEQKPRKLIKDINELDLNAQYEVLIVLQANWAPPPQKFLSHPIKRWVPAGSVNEYIDHLFDTYFLDTEVYDNVQSDVVRFYDASPNVAIKRNLNYQSVKVVKNKEGDYEWIKQPNLYKNGLFLRNKKDYQWFDDKMDVYTKIRQVEIAEPYYEGDSYDIKEFLKYENNDFTNDQMPGSHIPSGATHLQELNQQLSQYSESYSTPEAQELREALGGTLQPTVRSIETPFSVRNSETGAVVRGNVLRNLERNTKELTPVSSSNVRGVGQFGDELLVQFHGNKKDPRRTYRYKMQSPEMAEEAYNSLTTPGGSPGRWVWQNIRGHTAGEKVTQSKLGPSLSPPGKGKQTIGGTHASLVEYSISNRVPVSRVEKFEVMAKQLKRKTSNPITDPTTGSRVEGELASRKAVRDRSGSRSKEGKQIRTASHLKQLPKRDLIKLNYVVKEITEDLYNTSLPGKWITTKRGKRVYIYDESIELDEWIKTLKDKAELSKIGERINPGRDELTESKKKAYYTYLDYTFYTKRNSKVMEDFSDKIVVSRAIDVDNLTGIELWRIFDINDTYNSLPEKIKNSISELRIFPKADDDPSWGQKKDSSIAGFWSPWRKSVSIGMYKFFTFVGSDWNTVEDKEWLSEVLIHEGAHALDDTKLTKKELKLKEELFKKYKGRLGKYYAGKNKDEFFAEAFAYNMMVRNDIKFSIEDKHPKLWEKVEDINVFINSIIDKYDFIKEILNDSILLY